MYVLSYKKAQNKVDAYSYFEMCDFKTLWK